MSIILENYPKLAGILSPSYSKYVPTYIDLENIKNVLEFEPTTPRMCQVQTITHTHRSSTHSTDFLATTVLHNLLVNLFQGVKNFENVLLLYKSAKASLGEILSAFEVADRDSIHHTTENLNLP